MKTSIAPLCKNCRYWGVDYEGRCDRQGSIDGLSEFQANASADDDSNLSSWLETGPDFGCVHFAGPEPDTLEAVAAHDLANPPG